MKKPSRNTGSLLQLREVRVAYVTLSDAGPALSSPMVAGAVVRQIFSAHNDTRESLYALHVDNRGRLQSVEEVARGTVNTSNASPRDVFLAAILQNATGLILCHNHPSGDASPSAEDVQFTRRIAEFGRTFGVELIDHVIVAGDKTVSLRERGVL